MAESSSKWLELLPGPATLSCLAHEWHLGPHGVEGALVSGQARLTALNSPSVYRIHDLDTGVYARPSPALAANTPLESSGEQNFRRLRDKGRVESLASRARPWKLPSPYPSKSVVQELSSAVRVGEPRAPRAQPCDRSLRHRSKLMH